MMVMFVQLFVQGAMHRLLVFFLLGAMSALGSQGSQGSPSGCGFDQKTLDDGLQRLANQGYHVEQGTMYFNQDVHSFGANPSSPYGLYYFEEDPTAFWKVAAQDALLFHGCTPPPVSYFSWRSYLFSQSGKALPPFAALGDSLNQLEIKSRGGAGSQGPFDALATIVTTPDQRTYSDVSAALTAVGLGDTVNPADSMPSPWSNLGVGADADTFAMLVRVAVPLQGSEDAYKQYIATNRTVYRVRNASAMTGPASVHPRVPYPVPVLRNRTGPSSELSNGVLTNGQLLLIEAVKRAKVAESWRFVRQEDFVVTSLDSESCIEGRKECEGNNNDALYYFNLLRRDRILGPKDRFLVVGVNHAAGKKAQAVYCNLAVYHQLNSTQKSINDKAFQGSADPYVSKTSVPCVEQLFVVEVARDCAEAKDPCLAVPDANLPSGESFLMGGRAYLNAATKTGPAKQQVLLPVLLHFTMG